RPHSRNRSPRCRTGSPRRGSPSSTSPVTTRPAPMPPSPDTRASSTPRPVPEPPRSPAPGPRHRPTPARACRSWPRHPTRWPHSELNEQRATLADHGSALHRRREPWDVSVYETMQHLAELTSGENSPQTPVRFDEDILRASEDRRNILRGKLGQLASLGAFTLDVDDTVWFGADLNSVEEAEAARTVAERLGRMIPDLVSATEPVLAKAQLNPRRNIDDWAKAIRVLLRVRKTLDSFAPDVYDHRLDDLIAATGTPEYRAE